MPIEVPRGLPFAVDTWTPASALKRHRFLTHAHRDHLAGITATNVTAVYASRLTILTGDASSRFQVIGFPRLSERATEMLALARAKQQPEPLITRASSQWYAYYEPPEGSTKKPALTEPMRDEFGVWHICFSMHSSREELEQALRFIQPKWVNSTTPKGMAVELSYVKKHCFAYRLRNDEMIKKSEEEEVTSSVDESFGADSIKMQNKESILEDFEINMEPPETLFGMARFGLPQEPELCKDDSESIDIDELQMQEENSATECEQWKGGKSDISSEVIDSVEVVPKEQDSAIESKQLKDRKPENGIKEIDLTEVEAKKRIGNECVTATERDEFEPEKQKFTGRYQLQKVCKHKEMESVESIVEGKNSEEVIRQILAVDHLASLQERNKEVAKEETVPLETDHENSEVPDKASSDSSAIGSSKGLNANLRKLYRSMNVPVPRPLPSLVELMAASKRPRVSPVVQL
ncbi:hypothetical protein E2562_020804 [Oryza meyeriana var. granulata]|uniref:DNA repair metallo-beta-lactamase domain-containing protein n=1 Tax=Oryza meyeriana var. granulata TaxID=110450 RepID=A0A6G1CJ16_9ORYZ|nr:hypothetical protein E2562_020804 [Oryza meyeriana var. granulata]